MRKNLSEQDDDRTREKYAKELRERARWWWCASIWANKIMNERSRRRRTYMRKNYDANERDDAQASEWSNKMIERTRRRTCGGITWSSEMMRKNLSEQDDDRTRSTCGGIIYTNRRDDAQESERTRWWSNEKNMRKNYANERDDDAQASIWANKIMNERSRREEHAEELRRERTSEMIRKHLSEQQQDYDRTNEKNMRKNYMI